MPIKSPFKKTFKEKREALGISRKEKSYKDGILVEKGPIGTKQITNPKIRKLKEIKKTLTLSEKIKLLNKINPKNRLEANKINTEIRKLKNKMKEVKEKSSLKIKAIETKRKNEREVRQNKVLFKQLYSVAFPTKLNIGINRTALDIHYKFVRKPYIDFLKKNNKTFKQLTSKDAKLILGEARKEQLKSLKEI